MKRHFLGATIAALSLSSPSMAEPIGVCSGGNRAARGVTCIYDGDTGWQRGVKWRLLAIDAPELQSAACYRERATGYRSRDRLIELMRGGYSIVFSGETDGRGKRGRQLVSILLSDGRDAGSILIQEGLAQPWPNRGNVWCE